jgi:hypothetical protein
MRKFILISIEILLAAILGILGNVIAAYFQEKYHLTDTHRFIFIAVIFTVSLLIMVIITLSKSQNPAGRKNEERLGTDIHVAQRLGRLVGTVRGVRSKVIKNMKIDVDQDTDLVEQGGSLIGIDADYLDSDSKDSDVS